MYELYRDHATTAHTVPAWTLASNGKSRRPTRKGSPMGIVLVMIAASACMMACTFLGV